MGFHVLAACPRLGAWFSRHAAAAQAGALDSERGQRLDTHAPGRVVHEDQAGQDFSHRFKGQ